MTGVYIIYQDRSREWRWRYRARNGRIIADSAEGYVNKTDCLAAIQLMKGSYNDPVIEQ
jgi:uncharacterized protein YegP (UPF0339 family)